MRACFIQFCLSFLVVGSAEVIQRILQLRGKLSPVASVKPDSQFEL